MKQSEEPQRFRECKHYLQCRFSKFSHGCAYNKPNIHRCKIAYRDCRCGWYKAEEQ